MKISQKNVILVFPATRVARMDKMRGVLRFAAEVNTWAIDIHQGELSSDLIAAADGIIATGHLSPTSRRILDASSAPTAFIELETKRKDNIVRVFSDPQEVARQIATYFLNRGIYRGITVIARNESPAFHSFHSTCASTLNAIFKANDLTCSVITSATELNLDSLPLAVFASDDDLAAQAARFCRDNGLRIPQDVAVLGFSNDVVLCENTIPRISSVEPDFELQGYVAARELARMMSSRQPCPRKDISVDLKQIVERESTALPQTGEGLVRDALMFIKANATRPIGVTDVVRKLKVSRRLVELRFRERNNCSIHDSILKFRLEATAQELLNSKDSIAKVCERCGWRSENGPKKLFRKVYGMSMRDYRKSKGT